MFERQKTGSVLCPSCGSLVGVNDETCLTCGRRNPGLFGFAALLRKIGDDMGFVAIVMFTCGALFVGSLLASPEIETSGFFSFLAPHWTALLRLGGAGSYPVYQFDRWWTVLSYTWLHGSLLHLVFNMMSARDLIPMVAHLYGPARTVIIYTAGGAGGALLSSTVGAYGGPFLPEFLHGAPLVVGASGAIFGMMGALVWAGQCGYSRGLDEVAWRWILSGFAFGFMMARVDNWAHLGGLGAGYFMARWLNPMHQERGDHVIVAALCLLASAAAIVASLLLGPPFDRHD
jgi:rhomboid protease GluP